MVIGQQNYVSSNNIHPSLSARNICGPFDTQFKKKFLGRQNSSLDTEKKRLTQQPFFSTSKSRLWGSQANLLPKIREIQKIAKASGKKRGRINQYVDGVSDLQLYIAKKLIDRQSTAEIISKIKQAPPVQTIHRTLARHSLQNKDNQAVTDINQVRDAIQLNEQPQNAHKDFSQGHLKHKLLSDRDFTAKFDKFIVRRHDQDKISVKDMLGGQRRQFSEQIRQKITEDRERVTAIVQRMINQRANFVELQGQDPISLKKEGKNVGEKRKQVKNIEWIISECQRFQTRFRNRKSKNKSKTKITPKPNV